eukprot:TRINITY_DN14150_c0_g1_i1.p1 TRINITY_DN14150_c0_g1~~TRINITY_DN14150_c0_g1_i1.p1  ORF type:complete len:477 (-),score=119.16 TRINITY_DN14150_c0_g1_i1:113-1489(-)
MSETPVSRRTAFTKDFQRNSVVDFLILNKPLEIIQAPLCIPADLLDPTSEGYSAFLYRPRDVREYEEGFGPSVSVRVGDDDTVWKRSRNKWNPFEKIRTIEGVQDSNFSIMWDRTRANSYYVTERMYYYLDKEKHKEKFSGMRGKLYITRMLQKSPTDCIFLLQFIVELLSDDQMEVIRVKEDKKRKKVIYPIEEGRRASDGDVADAVSLSRLRANTTLPSINRLFNSLGQTQGPAFSADPFDALANAAALARASQPGFPGFAPGVDTPSFNGEEQPKPPARSFKRVYTHTKSRSIEQEPAARWRSYSQSAGPSSPCDPDSMETDGAPDAKRRSIDPAFALAGLSDVAMSTSSSRTQSPVPSEPRTPPAMPQMAPMFPMHPQFPFMANPFPFGLPSYGFPGSAGPAQVSDPSAMQVDPVSAAGMFPVHPMFNPFGSVMFSPANPMMMFPQAASVPKSS